MKPEDITITPDPNITHHAHIKAEDMDLGLACCVRDGLWRLHRLNITGMIDAWVLRSIADRLDEMNKGHSEKLDVAYKALPDEEDATT